MRFPAPLIRGTLIQRYKRFLSDVRLDSGEVVTAHCANSGAMLGVCDPGLEVWLSESDKPGRKLRYSWELARIGDGLVGINTMHPTASPRRRSATASSPNWPATRRSGAK